MTSGSGEVSLPIISYILSKPVFTSLIFETVYTIGFYNNTKKETVKQIMEWNKDD